MAQIIDGKRISQEIKDELKEEVAALKAHGIEGSLAGGTGRGGSCHLCLCEGIKKKAGEYTGLHSLSYELPEETTEKELLDLIASLKKTMQ